MQKRDSAGVRTHSDAERDDGGEDDSGQEVDRQLLERHGRMGAWTCGHYQRYVNCFYVYTDAVFTDLDRFGLGERNGCPFGSARGSAKLSHCRSPMPELRSSRKKSDYERKHAQGHGRARTRGAFGLR